MNTQITQKFYNDSSNVERIEHFQSFEAGQYWKAKVSDEEGNYKKDQVLLIQLIDWVDNKAHTLHILLHPSQQNSQCTLKFKIRAEDFLGKFEFEPEAESIRRHEIIAVQGEISLLQDELITTQSDPVKMRAAINAALGGTEPLVLPGPVNLTLSDSFDLDNVEGQVQDINAHAKNQIKLAEATSTWIQSKSNEISTAIRKLTPFFQEAGAVALAKVSEVTKNVRKIQNGIESLDLYTGKNVEVHLVVDGEECSTQEPLSIHQLVLAMDEEICVFSDIDERWDYKNRDIFYKTLGSNPDLLNTILPEERCVVMMMVRRTEVDYGDIYTNAALNKINTTTFLLVRNGSKVWAVYSPIASHLSAGTLFPKQSETDDVFRGIDGKNVNFEDLDYTARLNRHEAMALHYKRFLILLCGLDHRLNLFGNFYPGQKSLNFISIEFQHKYIKFVADADFDRLLSPGKQLPSAYSYISEINAHIQSGSRVLVYWKNVMNKDTAPGYFRLTNPGRPTTAYHEAIVQESKGELYLNCPLSNGGQVKVVIAKKWLVRGALHEDLGVVMLDLVDPEILARYVYERQYRVAHTEYINLFKRALLLTTKQRQDELPTQQFLVNSMADAGLGGANPSSIALLAMARWRAMNRGASLPGPEVGIKDPAMKSLLNLAFFEAGQGEIIVDQIKAGFEGLGIEMLRLGMTPSGKMYAYLSPTEDEASELPLSLWVKRVLVSIKKGKLTQGDPSWVVMKETLSEKTLYDSPECSVWLKKAYIEESREKIMASRELISGFDKSLALFDLDPASGEQRDQVNALISRYVSTRERMISHSQITEPNIHLPIAIVMSESKEGWNSRDKAFVKVVTVTLDAPSLLSYLTSRLGDQENFNFANIYSGRYREKVKRHAEARKCMAMDGLETLNSQVFGLGSLSLKTLSEINGGFILEKGYNYGRLGQSRNVLYSLEANANDYLDTALVVARNDLSGMDQVLKIEKVDPGAIVEFSSCTIEDGAKVESKWLFLQALTGKQDFHRDQPSVDKLYQLIGMRSASWGPGVGNAHGLSVRYKSRDDAFEALAQHVPHLVPFDFGKIIIFANGDNQVKVLKDVQQALDRG